MNQPLISCTLRRISSFHVVILQNTPRKCTKIIMLGHSHCSTQKTLVWCRCLYRRGLPNLLSIRRKRFAAGNCFSPHKFVNLRVAPSNGHCTKWTLLYWAEVDLWMAISLINTAPKLSKVVNLLLCSISQRLIRNSLLNVWERSKQH